MGGCIPTKTVRKVIAPTSPIIKKPKVIHDQQQDFTDQTEIIIPFQSFESLFCKINQYTANNCFDIILKKLCRDPEGCVSKRYFHYSEEFKQERGKFDPNFDFGHNLDIIMVNQIEKLMLEHLGIIDSMQGSRASPNTYLLPINCLDHKQLKNPRIKIGELIPRRYLQIQKFGECKGTCQVVEQLESNTKFKETFNQNLCKRVVDTNNCLINGGVFERGTKTMGRTLSSHLNPLYVDLLKIFGISPDNSSQNSSFVIYINPLYTSNIPEQLQFHSQILTYFEFKLFMQMNNRSINQLFNFSQSLFQQLTNMNLLQIYYHYVLIAAVKILMSSANKSPSNKDRIPIELLNLLISYNYEIVADRGSGLIYEITKIIEIMCVLNGKNSAKQIEMFVFSILESVSINTHILLDSFFIQFGIQVNEEVCSIRNNPLIIQKSIISRFVIGTEISNSLIGNLKNLKTRYRADCLREIQHIISHKVGQNHIHEEIEPFFQILESWEHETLLMFMKMFGHPIQTAEIDKLSLKDLQEEYYKWLKNVQVTNSIQTVSEYLLSMKIEGFLMILGSQTDFISKIMNTLTYEHKKEMSMNDDEGNNGSRMEGSEDGWFPNSFVSYSQEYPISEFLLSLWYQIWDSFNNENLMKFSSAELSVTILTLQGLMNAYQHFFSQEEDTCYYKSMQIIFRMNRDPRSKYRGHHNIKNDFWLMFIINLYLSMRKRSEYNLGDSPNIHKKPKQDINYFRNMYQCINVDTNYTLIFEKPFIEMDNNEILIWILDKLPTNNFSGIFYSKSDLLSEQDNYLKLSTAQKNKLFDSRQKQAQQNLQQLSNKSNYSESSLNRTLNRRNKKRFEEFIRIKQYRAKLRGVIEWGKGLISGPLMNPSIKNIDVLQISCGNFHTVIATSFGVLGWGQNSSHQLGSNPEHIYGLKLLIEITISQKQNIQLSCGNQHTAALINKTLYMWGPQEGGLTAGKGQKFDSISCGGLHNIAIRNNIPYSWGRGEGGQLGHKIETLKKKVKEETTEFFIDSPLPLNKLPKIIKSACGDAHSILLSEKGEVYAFGFSYQGQLGLGITGESETFQIFEPIKLDFDGIKIIDIFVGSTFTFFKTQEGTILCCGLNDCHQLGMGNLMKVFHKKYISKSKNSKSHRIGQLEYSRPKKMDIFDPNQFDVRNIYCGENHCLANVRYLNENSMIMGWGLNRNMQISAQFPPQNLTARTIDRLSSISLSQICCGSNYSTGLIQKQPQQISMLELTGKIKQFYQKSNKLVLD